ncbi:TonB-dependent siderophore receptor [Piscinibacter sp.]|uniref:TonB-dependent siderophore receptor n=1 Tax=Piscinibacter sp. TaxID=1903157 RepID=UPI0039E35B46
MTFKHPRTSRPASRVAPRPTVLAAALHGALLGLAIAAAALPQPARAQAAATALPAGEAVKTFNVPAGPLDAALDRFARTAGVNLSYDAALVAGLTTKGLAGDHRVAAALSLLLAGTGIEAVAQAGGGYSLSKAARAAPAVTVPAAPAADPPREALLPTVKVTARAERGGATEGTGSYTATGPGTSATGLSLTLRETPQSVSVLTRERIDDQAMSTLDDALRSVTGMVVRKGDYVGDSGSFNARGFEISNLMLDGLPISTGANGTFNPDNDALDIYDRIEVVRGATGLMTGAGTPSASINLVRKRPTDTPQAQITASVGSWSNRRLGVDAGTPLNASGSVRARAVVTAQDTEQFYAVAHDRNHQFYGVVEADVTPTTLVAAGLHYRRVDNDGSVASLPAREDGSFYPGLSRRSSFGNAFDYWKQTDKTAFAEVTQQLGDDWSVKLAATWKRPEQDLLYSGIGASDDDGTLYQDTQRYVLESKQASYDLSLKGSFELFQRRHELAFGASAREHNLKANGGWADYAWTTDGPVVDPYHWNPNVVPRPVIPMDLWTQRLVTKQHSFYAVSRWHLAEPLKLILGARSHSYDFENRRDDVAYKVSNEITPYAGVLYDIDARHTAYASWTEIFQPQSSVDRNGDYLKPITGVNYEAGVKGEYFDKRLNASIALFQIRQQNLAVDDLEGPNPCPGTGWGYCQRASGEIESKGVELEVSGALTPHWEITAGFTHATAKYTKDADPARIGTLYRPELPRNQFRLSTMYKLPGALQRWRIGGNVYAQNRVSGSWGNDLSKQKAYAIFGLQVGYRPTEKIDLRLVVNNLFDKYYYANVGWGTGGNAFGAPCNAMLTAEYRF